MSNANTTLDGLAYLLNQALANGQTYYIMLTSSGMSSSANMQTAASGEMSGNGYQRTPVTFQPATPSQDGFLGVITNLVQIAAQGGDIGPFNSLCLVTTASGIYGAVIGFSNYDTPQTIKNGTALSVQFPIEFTPTIPNLAGAVT